MQELEIEDDLEKDVGFQLSTLKCLRRSDSGHQHSLLELARQFEMHDSLMVAAGAIVWRSDLTKGIDETRDYYDSRGSCHDWERRVESTVTQRFGGEFQEHLMSSYAMRLRERVVLDLIRQPHPVSYVITAGAAIYEQVVPLSRAWALRELNKREQLRRSCNK